MTVHVGKIIYYCVRNYIIFIILSTIRLYNCNSGCVLSVRQLANVCKVEIAFFVGHATKR